MELGDEIMRLIHTLLFMFRQDRLLEDQAMAVRCLKSLEKGTYKTVVVYNQGFLTNKQAEEFLSPFDLNCIVIGNGTNVGIVAGRQACFTYIWDNYPDTEYISEIHLDMIFPHNWEDALVSYLDHHDEPVIASGIVDAHKILNFLDETVERLPEEYDQVEEFLTNLRRDKIVHGFTNPCVHVSKIFREVGGYNTNFLKGRQCFEDDSMLLGYYYYYGTKANWYPKVNYNTVVYHAIAGQRMTLVEFNDNIQINYNGLIRQYGAMGLKHLTTLHKSAWHRNFFGAEYQKYLE
jgi:hypothetical protein